VRGAPTRREALAGAARDLEAVGLESPRLEAERLLAHVTGLSRAELGRDADLPLPPREAGAFARALSRRLAGAPLQHIEGTVEFRELLLVCDARALVPRPETEQLVDLVVRWQRGHRPARDGSPGVRPVPRPATLVPPLRSALDIGTGSGAIALSLAAEDVAESVVALDVSADALSQAAENRSRLGLVDRVELRSCRPSIWDALRAGEAFDAIVSNPPYLREDEIPALRPEVREHEPRAALSGGDDGLEVIRTIVAGAADRLRPGGALFLEIAADQGDAVGRLLREAGRFARVEIRRDLAGRERFAVAGT
jgi:release factor glutamine methyltransferase